MRIVDAVGVAESGFAKNVAAPAARSDLLVFCDADDEVRPNWLRFMLVRGSGSWAHGSSACASAA